MRQCFFTPFIGRMLSVDRFPPRRSGVEHHVCHCPLLVRTEHPRHVPARTADTGSSLPRRTCPKHPHAGSLCLHPLHRATEQLRIGLDSLRVPLGVFLLLGSGHAAHGHTAGTADFLFRSHPTLGSGLQPLGRYPASSNGHGKLLLHDGIWQDVRLVRQLTHLHRFGFDVDKWRSLPLVTGTFTEATFAGIGRVPLPQYVVQHRRVHACHVGQCLYDVCHFLHQTLHPSR